MTYWQLIVCGLDIFFLFQFECWNLDLESNLNLCLLVIWIWSSGFYFEICPWLSVTTSSWMEFDMYCLLSIRAVTVVEFLEAWSSSKITYRSAVGRDWFPGRWSRYRLPWHGLTRTKELGVSVVFSISAVVFLLMLSYSNSWSCVVFD